MGKTINLKNVVLCFSWFRRIVFEVGRWHVVQGLQIIRKGGVIRNCLVKIIEYRQTIAGVR